MKIFEIGVGDYSRCRTLEYINTPNECWLFEPHPLYFNMLLNNLKNYTNFKLFNYAVGGANQQVELCLQDNASFIKGLKSPFYSKQAESETILVNMLNIKDIDPGDIDVIFLDIEGGEFDVLKHMKSRPKHILVEMYSFGVNYKNPNFDQIIDWMNSNNYQLSGSESPWPDKKSKELGIIGEDFHFIQK